MKALLVQPPFAQLNAPYPAVHYLAAFLRSRGIEARASDHSIELYRAIFSRAGIAPAFEAARLRLEAKVDEVAASQLERYLSYEADYLEWIDPLVDFLSGKDPAFAHRLAQAVELPRGMRAEAFLEAREGRIAAHEARGLATAILGDLGDLVAFALDPSFETVRYGERLAASASFFSTVRSALDSSPLLETLYRPLLEAEWRTQARSPDLLLVSIPFPGCLLGALECARSARAAFGPSLRILFGGGYVSTELRDLRDGGIFDFCDYLCFDSGYGSLISILEAEEGGDRGGLYRTMFRGEGGGVIASGFEAEAEPGSHAERMRAAEREAVVGIAPDYSDADFGRYLRIADSDNPMHALWSDSPWLKYCLARGCYWRRCAFCDSSLDYVSLFAPADIASIMRAASTASARTGLSGIHFVDEAMPMASLLAFADANRSRAAAGEKAFHFWGNVRFDSSWSEDRCEFLAASGLVAVSGGIEVATEAGLEMTDKGFDLAGLVKTLVAMKRSGLLVHAYLIYGFPGQSRQDVVDSAETCRQLFAAGLVDSAFWHRFVLTRHSRMYGEWREGGKAGLEPVDRPWDFANNDLGFAGSEAYDAFDLPLASLLESWMAGEGLDGESGDAASQLALAGLAASARGRAVPPNLIEGLAASAEASLDADRAEGPIRPGRARWIAGAPILRSLGDRRSRLAWTYRGEARELVLPAPLAEETMNALAGLGRGSAASRLELPPSLDPASLLELRASGLVMI
jgi:radical SAM superfamily enzyme YgiQ (UPF0313 family)